MHRKSAARDAVLFPVLGTRMPKSNLTDLLETADQALTHRRLVLPEHCNWTCLAKGKDHDSPAKGHASTDAEILNKLRSPCLLHVLQGSSESAGCIDVYSTSPAPCNHLLDPEQVLAGFQHSVCISVPLYTFGHTCGCLSRVPDGRP